ncbi:MAG: hypothetical protein WCB58_02515 [Acidobacteriaceae bacterium]
MQRTGRFFFAFFFGRSDIGSLGIAVAIASACPVISLPFVSAGFLSAISSGASLFRTAFFFVTSQSTPKPGKNKRVNRLEQKHRRAMESTALDATGLSKNGRS